jgi:hypothetical protein
VLLGIASLIKVFPLLIVVTALLSKKLKLAKSALITVAAGSLLTLLVFGWKEHMRYLINVIPNERFYYPDTTNVSIVGYITRLFSGFTFHNLSPVVSGYYLETGIFVGQFVALLVFAWVSYYLFLKSKSTGHKFDDFIIFAISPVLVLLVFPLSWGWGLIVLVLPIMILAKYLSLYKSPSVLWYLGLFFGLLVVVNPVSLLPALVQGTMSESEVVNNVLSGWTTFSLGMFLVSLITYLNMISGLRTKKIKK